MTALIRYISCHFMVVLVMLNDDETVLGRPLSHSVQSEDNID
jgi:hypothetical protein